MFPTQGVRLNKMMPVILAALLITVPAAASFLDDLNSANAYFDDKKWEQAIVLYEKFAEAYPHDHYSATRLSMAYYALAGEKKWNAKRDCLARSAGYARQAIEINERGHEAYLFYAKSVYKLATEHILKPNERNKALNEARHNAERALALKPDDYEATLFLGVWHRRLAERNRFALFLDRIFFAHVSRGSLYDAEKYLEKAAVYAPSLPEPHYELALVYRALGVEEKALEQLEFAIQSTPLNNRQQVFKEKSLLLVNKIRKSPNIK